MNTKFLPFEKDLEKIYLAMERNPKDLSLKESFNKTLKEIYSKLEPFDIVEIARHPERPHSEDYIQSLFTDFVEIHGDRCFGDDPSIITGIGKFNGKVVGVLGHRKGQNLKEQLSVNFGMANPEGYRKALRVAKLISEKFKAPIISFLDTPGANPTEGAEERGIASAIATNLMEFFNIRTPIIVVVIGEGGSGGALGIGIGDRILMLKYSIYSVISPEGCASILFGNASKSKEAAKSLKLTAQDLKALNVIDEIIEEPYGGAHRFKEETIKNVGDALEKNLIELVKIPTETLLHMRKEKFLKMGVYREE
ncbi:MULTISPECIES: acetyl-CoA carboxylase carboxyltransferase subunit alpha [Caldisericum]|jgi:acetyl-CoA carboxylase carboxyl transferase subunit alpha|uniref:Acetyl-coenzyme A carboxylase carboxyl transferase subunit alpha n=2 Tax=Caldisericum exile TaxID=693075 RepID=A0A2J6WG37_9BACT|nr:MAG: acetyl-CoA carboxylase carboxyl transferase subunit alpha [Caldisericum exile]